MIRSPSNPTFVPRRKYFPPPSPPPKKDGGGGDEGFILTEDGRRIQVEDGNNYLRLEKG